MKLDPRTIRWIRFALGLVVLSAFGLAYLLLEGFQSEVDRAVAILGRGDVAGLRDYILSFGAWAPVVSALLMVLQALVAPLPAFVLTFANGLAFGTFLGGMLSLVSASLAAAVSDAPHRDDRRMRRSRLSGTPCLPTPPSSSPLNNLSSRTSTEE
jgi:uncharacterized membrane protein YczE